MPHLRFGLLLLALVMFAPSVRAADASPDDALATVALDDAAADARPGEQSGKDAVAVSTVLLALVVVLGLLLLILTALWGRRVRRQVFRPLPTTSPRDELWHLRNRPKHGEETPSDGEDAAP